MAADTEAYAHDAKSGASAHAVETPRRMVQAVLGSPMIAAPGAVAPTGYGGAHGVVGDGLSVSYVSGSTVSVSAGLASVLSPVLGDGAYVVSRSAATAVACPGHASQPRIDLIVARVRNLTFAPTIQDAAPTYVPGTPGASPTVPAVPTDAAYLVLAEVRWPATAGAPVITDRRPFTPTGRVRCRSTTRPTGAALFRGLEIFEVDTGSVLEWDGAGWVIVSEPHQPWAPTTIYQGAARAVTVIYGWFRRSRGSFKAQLTVTVAATGATGVIAVAPPLTLAHAEAIGGTWSYLDVSTGNAYAGSVWPESTSGFRLQVSGQSNQFGAAPAVPVGVGDTLRLTTIEGRYA